MKRLIMLRHAKSDWTHDLADRDRPLAPRGRRQAPEAGRWLEGRNYGLQLALVSAARRAQETWELASAELSAPPPVQVEAAAYTFSARAVRDLIAGLDDALDCVVMVGHNPAYEDVVAELTGQYVAMPTSCLAVLTHPTSWVDLSHTAQLAAHGRPPR